MANKLLLEVESRKWHYSYREWDDSAAIVTDEGYCVAVRPRFAGPGWEEVAEFICETHNNRFAQSGDVVKA